MASGAIVAQRYAKALISTAREAGCLENVEADLDAFAAMLAESDDLRRLVQSPLFAASARCNALDALGDRAGFHKYTLQFFKVVVNNRRLPDIRKIIEAFCEMRARERGELTANVRSAVALDDQTQKQLAEKLARVYGQTVNLDMRVDESLLGGLVVTVDSLMIDDSLATKLQQLKSAMQNSANQSSGQTAIAG